MLPQSDHKTLNDNKAPTVQMPIKHKKLGSLRLKKGMKLFYLDLATGNGDEVMPKNHEYSTAYKVGKGNTSSVNIKPNHIYTTAINNTNAERKFKKRLGIK